MSGSPSKRLEDLASSGDVNPLKSDPELVNLLKKLDKVKKYKSFQRWKHRFLDRLEQFLYEEGMKPADKACTDFDNLLKKFIKNAAKVQNFIEKGELSNQKKTVKAALALNEMCNFLTNVWQEVEKLVPSRRSEEKQRGFTKFHCGAALIRQGFHQYISMKAIEDALSGIGTATDDVMDKQQHELFDTYKYQVQRFCDIMADLNLYEVMLKCLEFQEAPEHDESSSEEPVTYSITVDTHDGKSLTLVLDPQDTILTIKNAVANDCKLGIERQLLKFDAKILDDNDATLESLGLQDGSKLTVEPFKVPIKVNTMDGNQIKLMVDPHDAVSDLKKQLEAESGLPIKNQRLLMKGEELNDLTKKIGECGIKANTVLDLEPKSIKVTVSTPDGKKHEIQVKPSDTADSIKAKIADASGMAADRQVLQFNGKEIPEGQSVKEMGLKEGSELSVDVYKVPITVNTMDGSTVKLMVEPTDTLADIKKQLQKETGLPAKNQKLTMKGDELSDPNKTVAECGIKSGSVLDLEPKTINVTVTTPDGKSHEIEVKPSDTADSIKEKISKVSGLDVPRQVLKSGGKELSSGKTIREMGIKEGSTLTVEIFKIPITVKTFEGKTLSFSIEPVETVDALKKLIKKETGIEPKRQDLRLGDDELKKGQLNECGVEANSALTLEMHADPIIFVDIKCGTLFAVDREEVIKKQALTPNQNNALEFTESAKDSLTKDKIFKLLKDCATLGFSPQVVIAKEDVEDYELGDAAKVSSTFGVKLKKRERNKKGEEFLFIDIKTGAVGELARKKYIDMKFITPVKDSNGGETIEEREKDHMVYDKHIMSIRKVFGVKFE